MEDKLREAACMGDTETLNSLIRNGVDVNDQHKMNGWTALHWAAKRNEIQAIKVSCSIFLKFPAVPCEVCKLEVSTTMYVLSCFEF